MGERLLLRFSQKGALKFAGHLDVMRIFQRTLRRAGLPIAFSQGFNPHPLLSFALPLPLGMESENDYAEIVLTESLPHEVVMARLNDHAPDGLQFTGVTTQRENAPSAAARVAAADYLLTLPAGVLAETRDTMPHILRLLLGETQIIIPKKTKSGVRDTDIRPDIFALHRDADGRVFMRLAAGSARFLNPRIVAALILRRMYTDVNVNANTNTNTNTNTTEASLLPIKRLALWSLDNGFCSLQGDARVAVNVDENENVNTDASGDGDENT